ncbi:ricin-type beta-trefoil lectin domain protein [Streptomyces sp. NPDC102360]|uniref:ricin-type beta-trefoil lectin domain protein n=1 Tax=Streptomyces sp. NPDC102360 TaxID=3366160 RepID=UPI0038074F17
MSANGGAHATAPDHRLVAQLRGDTPTAFQALGELRGRHRHALLAYARVCADDTDAARQLGAQAFARAAREVARGVEPRGSWRHHALLLVHRTAAEWAADERRARLAPGLLGALGSPDAHRAPALLAAFHTLPARTQTLLWHSVVDGDSDAATGIAVAAPARDVAQARSAALDALRGACLAARVARAQGTHCRGYGRLIEEATRACRGGRAGSGSGAWYVRSQGGGGRRREWGLPCSSEAESLGKSSTDDNAASVRTRPREPGPTPTTGPGPGRPRGTADLDAHLARCPSCTAAYLELTALRDDPRRALAEGLLPWGGTDYLLTEAPATAPPAAPAPAPAPPTAAPRRHRAKPPTRADRRPARRARRKDPRHHTPVRATPMGFALASAAVGVALVPLLILTLTEGRPDLSAVGQGMGATPSTPPPARVTVTATTTATTTTTTTATATTTARSTETITVPPPPKPTTNPPRGKPSSNPSSSHKPKPPHFRPPGEEYAEVIDVASGLCLDVSRTPMADGDDVVAAKCDRTGSQQWRVDADRGVIQSAANPDFCLDNRGDTDRAIGLYHCAAADGDNAANLAFSVHGDGSIRPATDWNTALTPLDDGSFRVGQTKFRGGDEQRWRAGKAP